MEHFFCMISVSVSIGNRMHVKSTLSMIANCMASRSYRLRLHDFCMIFSFFLFLAHVACMSLIAFRFSPLALTLSVHAEYLVNNSAIFAFLHKFFPPLHPHLLSDSTTLGSCYRDWLSVSSPTLGSPCILFAKLPFLFGQRENASESATGRSERHG